MEQTDKSPFLRYVNEVNDARQIEMHTAELLATESTAFKFEMAVKNLNMYTYIYHEVGKLTKARCRTVNSETHKCINSVWIQAKMPQLQREYIRNS